MPGSWDPATEDDDRPASRPSSGRFEFKDGPTYLAARMQSRRPEYLSTKKVKIQVGSWNIGDYGCHGDLADWFGSNPSLRQWPPRDSTADIYVLGLQEVVDVNQTSNFIKYSDPKIALNWRSHVQVLFVPPPTRVVSDTVLSGAGGSRRRCRMGTNVWPPRS
jgi:hypothetical protein